MTVLFRPMPGATPKYVLRNTDARDAGQGVQPMAPTELNYDDPPFRVPRMRSSMVSYFAGLMQWATGQTWAGLFNDGDTGMGTLRLSPPNIAAQVMRTTPRGLRSVGGVLGAGSVSRASSHIPSVKVPRSIT